MSTDSIPQKRCPRCKNFYPLESFANTSTSKDGKYTYCRKCAAERKGRIWHPKCLIPDGYLQCGHCASVLPATDEFFHRNHKQRLGFQTICRDCKKTDDAKYLAEHRQENKEYGKKRYREKKEEYRLYKQTNAEKIAQQKREWRKNNPDKVKQHKRNDAKRNPESAQIRRDRWIKKHPAIVRFYANVRRERFMGAEGTFTDEDIHQIYEEQNGKCAYCGISIYFDIPHDVHIDHIQPLSRGGSNWPSNLALACADCNHSKSNSTLSEWLARRGW